MLEPAADAIASWAANGLAAGLDYMVRYRERLARTRARIPWVRRFIVAAAALPPAEAPVAEADPAKHGRVARYARGLDYHAVLRERLLPALEVIRAHGGRGEIFVDTAPFPERALAAAAGIGFLGKNTVLIANRGGPFVLLAVIATDLELPVTPHGEGAARCAPTATSRNTSGSGTCGRCTRCLEACPTGALVEPGVLDARLCLSYHTIESRDPIPDAIRARLVGWAFGCDVCIEVCPYTRRSATRDAEATAAARMPELGETAGVGRALSIPAWIARLTGPNGLAPGSGDLSPGPPAGNPLRGTALERAGRRGLLRNLEALAAAATPADGGTGSTELK